MKTKLVRGKWVIKGSGANRQPIRDGAIYIEGTEIRDVGPYELLKKKHDIDVELGSDRHIVMPGLVNSHDHGKGLTPLQRGMLDSPLELMIPRFRVAIRGEDTYANVLYCCMKQIENGVTSTLLSFFGPAEITDLNNYRADLDTGVRALIDSGMRAAFAPYVFDRNQSVYMDNKFLPKLPPSLKHHFGLKLLDEKDTQERMAVYFKAIDEVYNKYNGHQGRIKVFLGPWNVHWCSDELLKAVKEHATKLKTGIQIHLVETWYQAEYGPRMHGHTPIEHLQKLGFLGPEVSCAHSVWLTRRDMKIMAKTGAVAVHNPGSNLRLHSGIAPIHHMKQAGMNVAMGMDSGGTGSINDDEDMFQEMRLCSLLHRVPGIGEARLSSDEILDINLLGGAKALGFDSKVGSIEPGKKADIILVDTERLTEPYVNPKLAVQDLIVLRTKGAYVDTVIINGEVVMENRKFLKVDKQKVYDALQQWKPPTAEEEKLVEELVAHTRRFYKGWRLKEVVYRYNFFSN